MLELLATSPRLDLVVHCLLSCSCSCGIVNLVSLFLTRSDSFRTLRFLEQDIWRIQRLPCRRLSVWCVQCVSLSFILDLRAVCLVGGFCKRVALCHKPQAGPFSAWLVLSNPLLRSFKPQLSLRADFLVLCMLYGLSCSCMQDSWMPKVHIDVVGGYCASPLGRFPNTGSREGRLLF